MISAVVLAKNEASNIELCVKSLQWCDEVVVVDDGSTDDTEEIAISAGARVVQHQFQNFATQRNWAIEHAGIKSGWILHLDADEVASEDFADEVMESIRNAESSCVAFAICRKTMLFDRWLKRSDGFPVWIMRLTRRDRAWFESHGHGEVPIPKTDGYVGKIQAPIVHYAFSKGVANWIDRHNQYSTREALLEQATQSETISLGGLFGDRSMRRQTLRGISRRIPGRPIWRFVYQYIFKLGLLDGRSGLTFSLLMSVYEWLIVLKRRELESSCLLTTKSNNQQPDRSNLPPTN